MHCLELSGYIISIFLFSSRNIVPQFVQRHIYKVLLTLVLYLDDDEIKQNKLAEQWGVYQNVRTNEIVEKNWFSALYTRWGLANKQLKKPTGRKRTIRSPELVTNLSSENKTNISQDSVTNRFNEVNVFSQGYSPHFFRKSRPDCYQKYQNCAVNYYATVLYTGELRFEFHLNSWAKLWILPGNIKYLRRFQEVHKYRIDKIMKKSRIIIGSRT